MNSFVILGLGRFGKSVAKTLYQLGNDVLVIDENEETIQSMSECVTHAIAGDVTDENVLKACGIRNFDVAIVAIGGNMESSILVTVLLKEIGGNYIVAKAQNELHAKVLSRVGADKVIFPERDMGVRVAHNLVSTNILDYIELSPDYSIMEITVPKQWIEKSLKQLNVRVKYGINIMAIKNGNEINVAPKADNIIQQDDVLVIIGSNADIKKINEK
ncbi:TrkA family potassium uptake protein [Petroclostridium sp. X23]|jgi:trk system potassium uptake protein TrkA|uniref:potassium channel family protein n=1 Tax=Petroclostridium sp. X23 TaxID=3045146 RepID=UPI0024AD866D|nr:TrkA family potassium uptake protein [Petroclostridium sp. X23]WHH59522.1 TrkA family potassium uptake protein [Petroclostridium sp. X23]